MKTAKTIKKACALTSLALMCAAVMASSFTAYAATFDNLQAYGVDTIAGYSTLLSTSKTFPNSDIVIEVKKPDGGVVTIPAKTDSSGVAKVDLYDYYTRKAGNYAVSAKFKELTGGGAATTFRVYPDSVSVEKSTVVAGTTIAKADGADIVYVGVNVLDQYGNPFEGHLVNLISSRAVDNVSPVAANPLSDKNGNVTFKVSSTETGVSVYSAVDATSGDILSARAQVAYLSGDAGLADAGGSLSLFVPVAMAAVAGPLNHFEIADLPVSIQPNQNINFRVTAKDNDNVTVGNYTGTVHFSVEGSSGNNVMLPEDYTFKAEDIGTHLFSLGLSFTTAGTYKIVATDVSNTLIKGEKSVTVGQIVGGAQQQGQKKTTLLTPAAGTYSENVQTVSGTSTAGTTIKIFDNDQEAGSVQSDQAGYFTYQTNPLSDGKHALYAVSLDSSQNVKGTSDTIEINIDTMAPIVDEINVEPVSGITPGTVITMKVLSEENLKQAALIFNNDILDLTPDATQPGTYSAQVTAPANAGAYPVDVVLVDQLGNEATYQAKATVTVSAEGGDVTIQQTQETIETPENLPPSQVFGVIAYGSDKKVTLVWESANDDKNVGHYRIFYGLDPANMDKVVDTKSAATTWYVPNLENGKEFYFAIAAVDDEGLESINKSEVVSGIPFTLEVTAALPERPGSPLGTGELRGAALEGPIPPEMTKNGPELIWLLAGTGIFSALARKFQKRKDRR